jgi:hypothetical protein
MFHLNQLLLQRHTTDPAFHFFFQEHTTMIRQLRRILASIFFLGLSSFASAQNAQLQGQVTDTSGALVAKAVIRVVNQQTGTERKVETNSSGQYSVPGLDPSVYRIFVQASGFSTAVSTPIALNVTQNALLNFKLEVGAASESVTVDGSGTSINTIDATVGTVVDRKFVANIPLNGRSFQDLISMTPGVVTQSPQAGSSLGFNGDFSVNGQRTESNNYMVDGVSGNVGAGNGFGQAQNGTGGALGGSTALGTTQSLVSVDALQEFRVQSSTYSAEYGNSPGGQFSLLTRSGTNSLHGSVFDYLRNNFFDANDWFNDYYGKPTPALRQNDFGGTVGGPIWIPRLYDGRNRTFFFFSYEGLRLTQPTAATIQYVPDLSMRQQASSALQPILNAYPLPNGIDYGTSANPSLAQFIAPFSLPSSIDSTSFRIDQTFTPKLAVFFRYSTTPSSTSSRPFFARQTFQSNTQTYTLGATSQLSSNVNNEFRLGYGGNDATVKGAVDSFGGGTPVNLAAAMGAVGIPTAYPVMYFNFAGIGTSDFAIPDSGNANRQWNLIDNFSLSLGRHQIKVGGDYRRIRSTLQPSYAEVFAYFASPAAILNNAPDESEVARFKSATPIFNDTALFAQDEWHVSSRINVSMGVRWEVNPPPTEASGNNAYTLSGDIGNPSSLSLAPQGTPLWKTAWYNFAPRLGAAWTVHDRTGWETVLRGGGGVFYDTLNRVGALGYGGLGFIAFKLYSGASIPYTLDQLTFPITVTPPYTGASIYVFPTHLQLPYTLEWNTSLQQALGKQQSLTITYVGAAGRRLIGEQQRSLSALNQTFSNVYYFPGGLNSNYEALQVQFQRSIAHGVQALTSYTWSHSLDLGSADRALPLQRGDSDFDVRNSFQGGLTWDLPLVNGNRILGAFLDNWGVDGRLIARGAFPVPLQGSSYVNPADGTVTYMGLNVAANQPLYLHGAQYPGGKAINPAAFSLPVTGVAGNAPRNFVRGFGEAQINLAARREFHLHEGLRMQFRAETFNLLNHPNFGLVDPTYTDATFGQATQMLNQSLGTVAAQYQQGGARSMQFALKVLF